MAHVTFVHGIGNKPPEDELLGQWRVALVDDDGVDLDGMGVSSSVIYWANMLYADPAPMETAHESGVLELELMVDADDADLSWLARVPASERGFVERLGREVGLAAIQAEPSEAPPAMIVGSPLEALPLPPWLKQRLMRVFLRDVHHYLFDAEFTPRRGESFRIRRDVRQRAVKALHAGAAAGGPHIVVGHSLGSVIAYDVLTDAADVPRVDALITVGSPLGISEVRAALTPPWTSTEGWPSHRLPDGNWSNVFDALDPVCGGLDRRIARNYRRGGKVMVNDIAVKNTGSWRHSVGKYLGQPALRQCLIEALDRQG